MLTPAQKTAAAAWNSGNFQRIGWALRDGRSPGAQSVAVLIADLQRRLGLPETGQLDERAKRSFKVLQDNPQGIRGPAQQIAQARALVAPFNFFAPGAALSDPACIDPTMEPNARGADWPKMVAAENAEFARELGWTTRPNNPGKPRPFAPGDCGLVHVILALQKATNAPVKNGRLGRDTMRHFQALISRFAPATSPKVRVRAAGAARPAGAAPAASGAAPSAASANTSSGGGLFAGPAGVTGGLLGLGGMSVSAAVGEINRFFIFPASATATGTLSAARPEALRPPCTPQEKTIATRNGALARTLGWRLHPKAPYQAPGDCNLVAVIKRQQGALGLTPTGLLDAITKIRFELEISRKTALGLELSQWYLFLARKQPAAKPAPGKSMWERLKVTLSPPAAPPAAAPPEGCPQGFTMVNGKCEVTCPGGYDRVDGRCVDTHTPPPPSVEPSPYVPSPVDPVTVTPVDNPPSFDDGSGGGGGGGGGGEEPLEVLPDAGGGGLPEAAKKKSLWWVWLVLLGGGYYYYSQE